MEPQIEKARPLSCRADQAFISAVNEIARRRNMKTADFVKNLLVETLGDELIEARSFFASDGRNFNQMVDNSKEAHRATA